MSNTEKNYYFLCDEDGEIPASKQGAYMYRSLVQAQRYGQKSPWRWSSGYNHVLHVQWDGKQFNAIGIVKL